MKILSDFDGVWTDQAGEARFINECFVQEVAKDLGMSEGVARETFDGFLSATHEQPDLHGWWPRGFLTAFVDEDDLLATGAVCRYLDDGGDAPGADRWREGIRRAGHDSAHEYGSEKFGPAMRTYLSDHGHRLVDGARGLCERIHAAGVELVIVSNSPTSKLQKLFADVGVREREGLRFVGDARKWWIEAEQPRGEFAGRRVHLDRPFYRDILAREQPDVVIGDVASLDLAMPAAMRREGTLAPSMELLLRQSEVSAAWATGQVSLEPSERLVDRCVPSVLDLAGLLPRG